MRSSQIIWQKTTLCYNPKDERSSDLLVLGLAGSTTYMLVFGVVGYTTYMLVLGLVGYTAYIYEQLV